MMAAIEVYQQALLRQQEAEVKLEELRQAWKPNLTKKVITETDEDGNPTNWHHVLTKDKTVKKIFKKFQSQVKMVCDLSTRTNYAQCEMIKKINEAAKESNSVSDRQIWEA